MLIDEEQESHKVRRTIQCVTLGYFSSINEPITFFCYYMFIIQHNAKGVQLFKQNIKEHLVLKG